MDTMFINTENGKTDESNRFRIYFTDKLDLRRNKTIALANLSIYYTWENIVTINLKYQVQHCQKHLIYLMHLMKYRVFKIIF